jgi:hypothetical protein
MNQRKMSKKHFEHDKREYIFSACITQRYAKH